MRYSNKLYFMTLQHSSYVNITAWLKKPAVKLLCLCVAGLFGMIFLFHPFANHTTPQVNLSLNKPAASGSGGSMEKGKQCSNAATFSVMPGRLNRFLQ